jgi:molecular chaperone GrpE
VLFACEQVAILKAPQVKSGAVTDNQSSHPNDKTNGTGPAEGEKAADSGPPESEVDALKAERDRFREQLMRTAADFDNFRKRTKRDLDDAKARGRDDLIRELLPVFDNLDRAVQSSSSASDIKSVIDGVRMVLKMFEDTAERIGLARVKTIGERFDPTTHEALQQIDSAEHAPGTIVAEIAAGYRVGDRLVRPAMVVVARKPAEPKPAPKPDAAADAAPKAAAGPSSAPGAEKSAAGSEPAAGTVDSKTSDAAASAGGGSPSKAPEPSGKSGTEKPE